jgi:pheromone shutdown protein TraB
MLWSKLIPTLVVVCFIGGTHIGAHRDWPTTRQVLVAHHVAPSTIQDLERIFTSSCPNYVNVESSDENFHAFLAYGNHKTVLEHIL